MSDDDKDSPTSQRKISATKRVWDRFEELMRESGALGPGALFGTLVNDAHAKMMARLQKQKGESGD